MNTRKKLETIANPETHIPPKGYQKRSIRGYKSNREIFNSGERVYLTIMNLVTKKPYIREGIVRTPYCLVGYFSCPGKASVEIELDEKYLKNSDKKTFFYPFSSIRMAFVKIKKY